MEILGGGIRARRPDNRDLSDALAAVYALLRAAVLTWDGGTCRSSAEDDRSAATNSRAVAGSQRSTGRAGSAHHSLHEPAYSLVGGRPAWAMASRLWQAVTPEPH